METQKEDLVFLARLYHELRRPEDALKCLDQLAERYPDLDDEDRTLFVVIYKDVIDAQRHAIRTLKSFYDNEQHDHHVMKADLIKSVLDKQYAKLADICNRGLSLIRDRLAPHAKDSKAIAFYHTKEGDFNRYLGECGAGDRRREFLVQAKKAYESSLAICAEQLPSRDPVRLETILVSAVFEYEHMKKPTDAISLLKGALRTLGPQEGVVNEDAERTIQIMRKNVCVWSKSSP